MVKCHRFPCVRCACMFLCVCVVRDAVNPAAGFDSLVAKHNRKYVLTKQTTTLIITNTTISEAEQQKQQHHHWMA